MIYESKNGFYHKTYKYHITIGVLFFLLVLGTAVSVGSSIQSNRRYRAELERSVRLEQSVREQEQVIRATSAELGEIIQSSNERLTASITTVQELRETMHLLEDDYNRMRDCFVMLNDSISSGEE